jgi:hypothetical protein
MATSLVVQAGVEPDADPDPEPEPEADFASEADPEPVEFFEPAVPPVAPPSVVSPAFSADAVGEAAREVLPVSGPDDLVPDPSGPQAVRARANTAVVVAARSVVRLRMVLTKDPPRMSAANARSPGVPSLNC